MEKLRHQGFTLLEVMIALTIFSIFIMAYMTGHSGNIKDSTFLKEEETLTLLSSQIISEIKINPPALSDSLTLAPEVKQFEDTAYDNYEYSIEWKKLKIPDLSKLQGKNKDEDTDSSDDSETQSGSAIEAQIFKQMKDNIEKIIWQVKITVTNKTTGYKNSLSTFITNSNAKVEVKWQ